MAIRTITKIVQGSRQVDGAGVKLVRVIGHDDVYDFDPFLMLDAFDSTDPADYIKGFPWHPHRGIETVTYLIRGDIEHGDSLGNRGHIRDGGCQWMTAGGGIIHQEMPQPADRMLGLQLWLNLPAKDKMTGPVYRDLTAAKIPRIDEDDVSVAVIAGHYQGTVGATQGDFVKALVLDVQLAAGKNWQLALDSEATAFIYIFSGAGFFGLEPSRQVSDHQGALFSAGDGFAAQAGQAGLRFILFSGRPLREPIAWGGPIVMNTRQELQQAFAELDQGTFIKNLE